MLIRMVASTSKSGCHGVTFEGWGSSFGGHLMTKNEQFRCLCCTSHRQSLPYWKLTWKLPIGTVGVNCYQYISLPVDQTWSSTLFLGESGCSFETSPGCDDCFYPPLFHNHLQSRHRSRTCNVWGIHHLKHKRRSVHRSSCYAWSMLINPLVTQPRLSFRPTSNGHHSSSPESVTGGSRCLSGWCKRYRFSKVLNNGDLRLSLLVPDGKIVLGNPYHWWLKQGFSVDFSNQPTQRL